MICQQGLQFFPDRAAAASEVLRALAPDGRVAAAVWQGIDRQPFWKAFTEVEAANLAPLGLTRDDVTLPFSWGDPDALRGLLTDAGFDRIELSTATIEADFAAKSFVEDIEYPYGALVPGFLEDPAAFASYVDAVREQSRDLLHRYRRGDRIVFETPANLVLARRPS